MAANDRRDSESFLNNGNCIALRARLLSGTSSAALAVASIIVALGVCTPGDAWAQSPPVSPTTTVNPGQGNTQTTTFTLTSGQNPITFGGGTDIDTSATAGADAVHGNSGTIWDVTVDTQALLKGNRSGILFESGGATLDNSGTISQTSTISGVNGAVVLNNGGTVTNRVGGKIDGAMSGIVVGTEFLPTTVINFGSITATDGFGAGVLGPVSSLTNRTGGTISSSNGVGIDLTNDNATVVNEQNATISGKANGIVLQGSDANLTNAGTITATGTGGSSVFFQGTGTNTLTLQTGSVLNGDAVGSVAVGATNNLVLQGSGGADNNFSGFQSLKVQASNASNGWTLNGNADVGTATIDTGKLTIGSSGTLTGSTTIELGELIVNGTHTGKVSLAAFGIAALSGVGTISGNVQALAGTGGGTLVPGIVGTPGGTLTVNGNVDFTGLGFSVFVDPAQASKLAISGQAKLAGADVLVAAQSGVTYQPSKQYTILTAAGGLVGTFGFVQTNLAFLTPALTHDTVNNKVVLTLTCNPSIDCGSGTGGGGGGGGTDGGGGAGGGGGGAGGAGGGSGFAVVAQTQNQTAVATALNGGGVSNALFSALLNLTADGGRQAFDALSGEVFASVHNVQAGETQFARSAMLGRLRQASYAGYVGELGALAFGGPELAYAGDNANGAYAADIRSAVPGKAPARTVERSRDLTFWAQGLGGWGHTDSDGNAAAVHGRFGGFLSGVDARFGETLRAGFVAGYLRSDLNVDDRSSSAGIDSVQIGAYAGTRLGALNVRGGASYSFDSIDVSRGIFFPGFTDQTKASFHGNVGQVFGEVGYGMTLGHVAVEPLAGLAYVHVHDGSFLESGGAAALSGASTHEDIGYSFLGARAATVLPLANGTALVPHVSAQWQYAFGDVTPVAGLAFQGTGAAFSVAGVPIARNTALIETGFDWRFSPWAKLGAFYQGELSAHAESHAFKGAFSWNF